MNTLSEPGGSASAKAARELVDLLRQIDRARGLLARLQSDIEESSFRIDNPTLVHIVEANDALVLTLLRLQAEYGMNPAGSPSDRAELLEANEHLVFAALEAQDHQLASESARRRQTEFLAVLAHELRGPLAPIRTAASLLSRMRTDDPAKLTRLSDVIDRQVVHVARLVSDLLDVSRLHTGKLRLECERVEVGRIIEEVCEACRPAMEARQQRFSVQTPLPTVHVSGDGLRLTQVFRNLLENASKYTQNGGDIRLEVAIADDFVVITVSDNGIGITAEALEHVFEPFVQEAHAADYNLTGLGIGLALAHQLVEAHGGTIVARSAGIGQGSRFVTRLPLFGSSRSRPETRPADFASGMR